MKLLRPIQFRSGAFTGSAPAEPVLSSGLAWIYNRRDLLNQVHN